MAIQTFRQIIMQKFKIYDAAHSVSRSLKTLLHLKKRFL